MNPVFENVGKLLQIDNGRQDLDGNQSPCAHHVNLRGYLWYCIGHVQVTWFVLEGMGNVKIFFGFLSDSQTKTKPKRERQRATNDEDGSLGCVRS